MASSSPAPPPREPGWLQWQPLSPLVAATALWFLGRVWHHHFDWPIWAALILSAWAGSLVARGSAARPDQHGERPLFMALVLAIIATVIALRWLPRGLVVSAVPIAGLAAFQALMSLGNQSPLAQRLALAGATLGAIGVLAAAPFNWPPGLRPGLIALALILSWSVWKGGRTVAVVEAPVVLARGLVFAAGVLLPVAWWTPDGLLARTPDGLGGEMTRPENLGFALLAIVATTCRSEWRKPVPSRSRLAGCAVASLALTGFSALGVWAAPAGPVRLLFFGVGAVAFLLGTAITITSRSPVPQVWQRLVPDLAWVGLGVVGLWPR